MIPYGRQFVSQEDIDAVVKILRSDFITQGPAVPAFEKALRDYAGASHSVAVSSATAALHIACMALGLKSGGLLWTSPVTFVASANCALYCGAEVDFVDVNPRSGNLCIDRLKEKLVEAKQSDRLPDILIPVHLGGQSCDMETIAALSKEFGFRVIEDASHAVGGSYKSQKVGSCQFSDITVFSFHPVKIITTGEGGMALTNDDQLAERMRLLRSHGITRDTSQMVSRSHGDWYYQQIDLGFNFRMTDIQAALGLSQFQHLDEFVDDRQKLAESYDKQLESLPLKPLDRLQECQSAWHLYVVLLEDPKLRKRVFEGLRENGVGVNIHYIPVHLQPYYKDLGFNPGDFPNAEDYYQRAISLPMYPKLASRDLDYVCGLLGDILN
ncbi:MAG: UDP-4-amino-4,6-dideoxy-N-acetyl-beta-L-altrosamine transaminase [Pseudomonadota bacterium]